MGLSLSPGVADRCISDASTGGYGLAFERGWSLAKVVSFAHVLFIDDTNTPETGKSRHHFAPRANFWVKRADS
jgi:hypothetical protein